MKHNKPVTIVINTFNRASQLKNTLQSLCFLDYQNFEVVVVNGPSTDETSEFLNSWEGKIKIGHCPQANLSISRNIGIAMASGEFVAFMDDGAIPEPEWLCQAMAGFADKAIAATGGKVFNHTGYEYHYHYATANRLGKTRYHLTSASLQYCFPYSFEFPYVQGTNVIFRRDALLRIGGFNEEYDGYLDDVEVCLRLVDAGYIVCQLPNAYVHHKDSLRLANRYPILKGKLYFSYRYARTYQSAKEIDADNEKFIQESGNDLENSGLFFLAKQAAGRLPKLISSETLSHYKLSQFQPFQTICPAEKKLKIVLMCEDYPPNLLGGIARFTHDKATALAQLGHKVHVITCGDACNTVDLEDGVWVHRMVPKFCPLTDEASRLNVPQSLWDVSCTFLNEVDRIATHYPINIVEAPIWNVIGIATLLSKRFKLITSLQTTLKLSLPSRPDLREDPRIYQNFVLPVVNVERILIKISDHILGSSHSIVKEIETAYEMDIPLQKLTLVNYGMSDWRKKAIKVLKPSNKIRLLFVGRLETRKGIDVLLEIVPELCETYPQVEFNIVGDDSLIMVNGKTYKEIFESSVPPSIRKYVKFHGKLSEERLQYHYASCDIFIAPSRFESFGLIFVEAMMFSKPVIGCLAGGISEVVEHGVTGLLAQPGDKKSLYECITKLIEDAELRLVLGLNGRARYEKHFFAERMAAECVKTYSQL